MTNDIVEPNKHIRESRLFDGRKDREFVPFHIVIMSKGGGYAVSKYFPNATDGDDQYRLLAPYNKLEQADKCFELRNQLYEGTIGYKNALPKVVAEDQETPE